MKKTENSAARLLKIIQKGKELDKAMNCRSAWFDLLDVSDINNSMLMERLGMVMRLPDRIKYELNKIENIDIANYLHWEPSINKGFMSQVLNSNWSSFIDHVSDQSVTFLSITADIISSNLSQNEIEETELNSIKIKIQELLEDIENSNISPDVSNYVRITLQNILLSLEEYEFLGGEVLKKSLENMLGSLIVNDHYNPEIDDSKIGKRFWSILAKFSIVVGLVVSIPQLPEAIQKYFPSIEYNQNKIDSEKPENENIVEIESNKTNWT